jgi:methyl-accepting chemotaxis protein
MNAFLQKAINTSNLPAVGRCLKRLEKIKSNVLLFGALSEKIGSKLAERDALLSKFFTEPALVDFDTALKAIAEADAAGVLQQRISLAQSCVAEQLEKDPSAIEDMRAALSEIIGCIEQLADRVEKDERVSATKAGLEYQGESPTLRSIREALKIYSASVDFMDSHSDETDKNLFRRYVQLIS